MKVYTQKLTEEFLTFLDNLSEEEWKKWQEAFNQEIQKIGEDRLRADYDFFEWVFDEGEGGHYLEHFNQIRQALNK